LSAEFGHYKAIKMIKERKVTFFALWHTHFQMLLLGVTDQQKQLS